MKAPWKLGFCRQLSCRTAWNAPLSRDLPRVTLLRDVKLAFEPWLIAAIDFISTDASKAEPGFGAIAERLVDLIFITAVRKSLLAGKHEPGWMRGLTDPTISRSRALCMKTGRRWTLRELAVLSGRSRSGLARHFKQVMGETPFAYLTRWRMHMSAGAIAGGESTAETSFRLGITERKPSRERLLPHSAKHLRNTESTIDLTALKPPSGLCLKRRPAGTDQRKLLVSCDNPLIPFSIEFTRASFPHLAISNRELDNKLILLLRG